MSGGGRFVGAGDFGPLAQATPDVVTSRCWPHRLAPPARPPVTFLTVLLTFVLSDLSEEPNCLPAFVSGPLDWLPVFLTLPAANVLGVTLLPVARTLIDAGGAALNGVLSLMPKFELCDNGVFGVVAVLIVHEIAPAIAKGPFPAPNSGGTDSAC